MRREFLPMENGIERPSRGAQYLRMSTEHQKYSIQNQADAIATYAGLRNIEIVCTYADEGRSGLRLDGRNALQRLLNDVRNDRADFEFILVYDVSRWGRFQDADESAYYEYTCKEAGIQVIYCAEQFENDGSLTSTILKNLKRAMAAEFSRELSNKVFVGSCRLAKLGYRLAGTPYGLRRHLIDQNGALKAQLEHGQRKSLRDEHVILTPGPRIEVRTVRRIFASYVIRRKSKIEIAAELNADQIPRRSGEKWRECTIRHILTNEAYIGNNVYNQTSYKLKQRRVTNPPDMWIRRDGAFQGIVPQEMFAKAQEIISRIVRRPQHRISSHEALRRLDLLFQEKGRLSHRIMEAAANVPSRGFYIKRFGSLAAAYSKIGYQPETTVREAKLRSIVESTAHEIVANVKRLGGTRLSAAILVLLRWTRDGRCRSTWLGASLMARIVIRDDGK